MVETVRKNIELIRIARGFSQEGMAAEMHKTQSAYARFESGKTKIDLHTLELFAKVNNMSIIDVITYPKKYVDIEEVEKQNSQLETIIQFRLPADKKTQILKLLFGEKAEELL